MDYKKPFRQADKFIETAPASLIMLVAILGGMVIFLMGAFFSMFLTWLMR